MEPRTTCFCLLWFFLYGNPGYPETYHQYIDKNGVKCFSNSLRDEPFSTRGRSENIHNDSAELKRAREQAEIEYWRAVEAKARSLRNTPDTEVHRKGRPPLQEENVSRSKAPKGKKFRRWEMEKPDSRESKMGRTRKIKVQGWKNARNSNPTAGK